MFGISIIALIISGILAMIRIYDFIKEKYNVKVRLKSNCIIFDGSEISKEKTYMIISIVNTGREPVTIINAGLLAFNLKKMPFYLKIVLKILNYILQTQLIMKCQ